MRKVLVAVFMVLSFAGLGNAQVPTSGNIFLGYSYYNSKLVVNRANLNGWEGSLEGKVFPHVGIVALVDTTDHKITRSALFLCCWRRGRRLCHCQHLDPPNECNARSAYFLLRGKWRPFGQGLFGVAHISSNGFGSNNSFAMALGGGLDYRIVKPVAWRFQMDYMRTQLNLAGFGFSAGSAQNNFRFRPASRFASSPATNYPRGGHSAGRS